MKKERDLRQVKRKSLPKSPGEHIISYDDFKVKKGSSEVGAPSISKGEVKGGK